MAANKEKPRRLRSPAYPAIDLESAIRRAKEFQDYAHTSAVTVSHVVERWGIKPSTAQKVVAALSYYGLTQDMGAGTKRKIQLTERARRILVDHDESDLRAQAIIDAALSPAIYGKMWEEWGSGFPPEAEMRSYLIFENKFNERFANGVIVDYKATIEYAGLLETDIIPDQEEEFSDHEMNQLPAGTQPTTQIHRPQIQGAKSIEIPIPTTPWPILTVNVPMTEEKWKQMINMLNAMKPAIVSGDDGEENEEG